MLSKREVEEIAERAERQIAAPAHTPIDARPAGETTLALVASLREAMEALEDALSSRSGAASAETLLYLWNHAERPSEDEDPPTNGNVLDVIP